MKEQAKEHYCRERVAKWPLDHGYSTGHGDTLEDLLDELVDQLHQKAVKDLLDDSEYPF